MTAKKHPEQRSDEIYMGNGRANEVAQCPWRTSRLGDNPLMADGSPFTHSTDLRPWFIQRSEVEAAIEAERLNNTPWSAETIRVYESMLCEEGGK